MNSLRRVSWLAGAVCLTAAQAFAADGVLLVQKITAGNGTAMTHQAQIEPHRMRVETAGVSSAGSQVFVFDGTRQVMLMINDATRSYSEISKADVDAISGQMSAATSQMQDAMKNLPPEQRARMESMMRGRMGGAAAAMLAKPEYRKVGSGTVGKWSCDKYEGYRDGQKVMELCTVDPKALGFAASDFAVTQEMAAFFQKLMPANAAQLFHVGTPDEHGFSGVPVRTVLIGNGQTTTMEVTDVRRQTFPDALFQAPAGYQKQDSPFGRGRRGGR